ncbi:MAG TPA: alanine racemase [Rectinemataceae bacterium]|nr:alanine racemase [Rectinemataceae bacterium]
MEYCPPPETDRPTRAEIRLGALRRNFRRAKALAGAGVKVMAVVKANAYGHGIVRVARELLAEGADHIGVAYLEEGVCLREAGIETPILVFGAPNHDQIPSFIEYDLELSVPSAGMARAISAAARDAGTPAKVHLKVDTGMERIGEHWYSCEAFFDEVLDLPGLEIHGVFSHFATSDDDLDFAREQLERFRSVLAILESRGRLPPLVHIANSAGLVNLPESRFTMVRPGILLYGYEPTPLRTIGFEPVMRLMSRVAFLKEVRSGAGVSYGRIWIAPAATRIATIPIGYGDGYSRSLSNRAEVHIGGARHPVVGRVCMDQIMVDLGSAQAREGDEVVLFGERAGGGLPAELLCGLLGTIPYELTCMVSARVPRIYVEE